MAVDITDAGEVFAAARMRAEKAIANLDDVRSSQVGVEVITRSAGTSRRCRVLISTIVDGAFSLGRSGESETLV